MPLGWAYSLQDQGADDALDSDADQATGTFAVTLAEDEQNTTTATGLVPFRLNVGGRAWDDVDGDGAQDAGEGGIDDVTVRLFDGTGAIELASTTTAAGGFYGFGGVAAGYYVLEFARPSGYFITPSFASSPQTDSEIDRSSGRAVVSAPGIGDVDVDAGFIFSTEPGITGRVFFDNDGDGVKDAAEPQLDGFEVELLDQAGIHVLAATDASGDYAFSGLGAGTYNVRFTQKYQHTYVIEQPPAVTLAADWVNYVDAPVRLDESGASVTVHVWNDYTLVPVVVNGVPTANVRSNGIRDTNESGISDVAVKLLGSNRSLIQTGVTDAYGNVSFNGLPGGDYFLKVEPPSGQSITQPFQGGNGNLDSDFDGFGYAQFTLNENQHRDDIDAGLINAAGGLISGSIWKDRDGDGYWDSGESGLRGDNDQLRVSVYNKNNYIENFAYLFPYDDSGDFWKQKETGEYYLGFAPPANYQLTSPNIASEGSDSDFELDQLTDRFILSGIGIERDGGIVQQSQLPANGKVKGRLWYDADQDGLQDSGEGRPAGTLMEVNLWESSGGNQYRVARTLQTDNNGYFQMGNVPPGDYTLEFELPAGMKFTTQNLNFNSVDQRDSDVNSLGFVPLTVAAGITVDFDAGVRLATASLGNRVWEDLNGNGIQDDGEPGIEGAEVLLYDRTGVVLLNSTRTDSAGHYDFAFAGTTPANDYVLQFIPPHGYSPTTAAVGGDDTLDSDADPLTGSTGMLHLGVEEIRTDVDAGFVVNTNAGGALIGSLVWNDLNGDGVQDAGEPGVDGVEVRLTSLDTGITLDTTATISGGRYNFRHVTPGDYRVEFVVPAQYDFTSQDAGGDDAVDSDANPDSRDVVITVDLDTVDLSIDAGLIRRTVGDVATIGSFVWHDLNRDGVQNSGEPGVSGASVLLYDEFLDLWRETTTDDDGAYQFGGLPAGEFRIQVIPPGGFDFSPANIGPDTSDSDITSFDGFSDSFNLAAGQHYDTLDAGLVPATGDTASISNFVWNDINGDGEQDGGEPGLPGIAVRLFDQSGAQLFAETTTNADGGYRFGGLAGGSYIVEVSAPVGYNYSPQDQGGDEAMDSDVDPAHGRTGLIVLAAGEQNDAIDAGLIDNRPLTVIVDSAFAGLIPGDDPDGAGPLLAIGIDAAASFDDLNLKSLRDGTTLQLAGEAHGDLRFDAAGKTLNVDATAAGVSLASIVVTAGTVNISGSFTVDGEVQPGGTLSVEDMTFAASASLDVQIDGPGDFDQFEASGVIDLGGATMIGDAGFGLQVGERFVIINNTGTSPISGTFASGSTVILGTALFSIDYAGGDGNDVELTYEAIATGVRVVGDTVVIGGSDNRRDKVYVSSHGSDLVIRSRLGGGHWETLRVPQSSVNSITANLGGKSDRFFARHDVTANITVNGGDGNDHITTGSGDDVIFGGEGNDSILAGVGDDHIDAGSGNNRVFGQDGDDVITAGNGNDVLFGGDDDDVLIGGGGHELLLGGRGNDLLAGGDGKDTLFGGRGDDVVIGGDGRDLIFGDGGEDLLIAGATTFDANDVALRAILNEWSSGSAQAIRRNNLMTGGGDYLQGIALVAGVTVLDDNDRDLLFGGRDEDWFWADLGEDRLLGFRGFEDTLETL